MAKFLAPISARFRALIKSIADQPFRSAQATLLEKLFNDMYHDRKRIYRLNFFRGIFFGLGSVLGGTLVLSLLLWLLSLFVDFPLIGEWFEGARQSIEQ